MTTTKAKSKKATLDICSEISNKISTREALFVIEATRQNVLEAFLLPSNHEKLPLVAAKSTSLFLAGLLSVKVLSKRHTWVSPSVVSTPSKSPKIFNNRPVNKLVFPSIASTSGVVSISSSKKIKVEAVACLCYCYTKPLCDLCSIIWHIIQNGPRLTTGCVAKCEAKQSPLVESPVLKNWADQMETESSPFLVSGATSGGAWETITSHQRFAEWMVSTLVSNATFKIKLAHVKTVFQSVHGFLGAKSVSKDNVKLFCIEFASQQSLEAAFLVELTSSVCLATFKIAKSLVVSESGSSLATVVLHNVLLGVSAADIKMALSVFGKVAHVVLKSANIWQYVVVYFKELDTATANEAILFHDRFKAKLVNLLSGCTAFEISNMISRVGGRTCFIPWFHDSGYCSQFALVIFDSQNNLDFAVVKTSTLRKYHIWWETSDCQRCFRCQEVGHLAADCKVSSSPIPKVPKVFKSHFVDSASYAKTAAPFGLSEFPSLVALLAASAADPAVGFRFDFLEKQISDLAALVKFIVELVGSLVALVSRLLDDNTVKTSAANNFANLIIEVSKDIACLRSEQMSSAESRSNIKSTRLFFSKFIFDSRNLNGIIERIHGLGLFSPTFDSV
ncbi:hypothetical protein G9A89_017240 [Geosiphon pyriformis]|nr:hypothetical protein G9A89_017240 [Geosiphon pyriformis]